MTQGPEMPPGMPEQPPMPPGQYGMPPPWAMYPPVYAPVLGYYGGPPPAPKPRVWTVFVGLLLAVLAGMLVPAFAMGLAIVVIKGPEAASGELPLSALANMPGVLLAALAMSSLALGACALLGGAVSPIPLLDRLRLRPANASYLTIAVMALGIVALATAAENIHALLHLPQGKTLPELEHMISQFRGPLFIVTALVVALCPGVCEELLLRGYVQTRLRQRWGRLAAILIAGVLFGAMHMDVVQSPMAMLLGFYLGYVAERTGSIRPAIFCHIANNSVASASMVLPVTPVGGLALLVSLVVLLLCIVWIQFSLRDKPWPRPADALLRPAYPPAPLYAPYWPPSPYMPPPPLEQR